MHKYPSSDTGIYITVSISVQVRKECKKYELHQCQVFREICFIPCTKKSMICCIISFKAYTSETDTSITDYSAVKAEKKYQDWSKDLYTGSRKVRKRICFTHYYLKKEQTIMTKHPPRVAAIVLLHKDPHQVFNPQIALSLSVIKFALKHDLRNKLHKKGKKCSQKIVSVQKLIATSFCLWNAPSSFSVQPFYIFSSQQLSLWLFKRKLSPGSPL